VNYPLPPSHVTQAQTANTNELRESVCAPVSILLRSNTRVPSYRSPCHRLAPAGCSLYDHWQCALPAHIDCVLCIHTCATHLLLRFVGLRSNRLHLPCQTLPHPLRLHAHIITTPRHFHCAVPRGSTRHLCRLSVQVSRDWKRKHGKVLSSPSVHREQV